MTSIGGTNVKSTWVTHHVPDAIEWAPVASPRVGDLLLCRVESIGIHGRVETTTGARQKLYIGDQIAVALANRYATSMLEAVAEVDGEHCDMVSASGLCGRVVRKAKKASNPTRLRIEGQAHLDGMPFNLRATAVARPTGTREHDPRWIVVVGSAMDSGKTTACASIIRGMVESGHSVGAGKLTGTASARDLGSYRDAGALPFLDFLDAGWPSTVGCTERELLEIVDLVTDTIRVAGVDCGVLEIADGVLQPDTRFLLGALTAHLGKNVEVVLTVREALSAVGGAEQLLGHGLDVAAVSGLLTNSPMACREAELALPAPCVPTSELGRFLAKRRVSSSPEVAALT
jgi:hypothetical protein